MLKLLNKFKKLCLLLFAVNLCSCGSVPKRPHGEVCAISTKPLQCVCVDSDSGEPTSVKPIEISENGCGGFIAISPEYYGELENWTQELIKRVRGFPRQKALATENLNQVRHSVDSAINLVK